MEDNTAVLLEKIQEELGYLQVCEKDYEQNFPDFSCENLSKLEKAFVDNYNSILAEVSNNLLKGEESVKDLWRCYDTKFSKVMIKIAAAINMKSVDEERDWARASEQRIDEKISSLEATLNGFQKGDYSNRSLVELQSLKETSEKEYLDTLDSVSSYFFVFDKEPKNFERYAGNITLLLTQINSEIDKQILEG